MAHLSLTRDLELHQSSYHVLCKSLQQLTLFNKKSVYSNYIKVKISTSTKIPTDY